MEPRYVYPDTKECGVYLFSFFFFFFPLIMSTFVNEQVKRLNTSLTQSFEKHLANTASLSSLNEKDKFLLETSQALDLTSASLPSFEKVQEYLEKYSEFKAKGDISATSEAAADPALEWLFVAKCTIAVYGQVFSKVLNLTLPISESIDYWNSIQGSTINELYYAMQSKREKKKFLLKSNNYSHCFHSCTVSHLFVIKEHSQTDQQHLLCCRSSQITLYIIRLCIIAIISYSQQ